jgi:hypothetical protein
MSNEVDLRKIIEQRTLGVSFADIAYNMPGYSEAEVRRMVDEHLADYRESPDAVRAQEMLRLDALHRTYWRMAAGGDQRAAAIVLKVMERRAKMLGLDAPTKIESPATSTADLDQEVMRLANLLAENSGNGRSRSGADDLAPKRTS